VWAVASEYFKVVVAQPFSDLSAESLVIDLRVILTPQYSSRAHEVATRMTKPAESLARTADLV
jgi:UDP:flavonoid glycosyltransferase YjiC (YdhE family)